jgi:hypothetical protein
MEFSNEQKIVRQIVQKAWDNADFKTSWMIDPRAIENLTGKKKLPTSRENFAIRDQQIYGLHQYSCKANC